MVEGCTQGLGCMEKLTGPGHWARTVVGLGLGVLGTWPLAALLGVEPGGDGSLCGS